MQSPDLLTLFLEPLEKSGIRYFVTGSIASIFYGEPRLTHDIDVVIHLPPLDVSRFSSFFPSEKFYCPPDEVIQIECNRRPYGHFNLIHHESGFKADIYPDADDPLHEWAFKNRKRLNLEEGRALWLAPAEYVIIRKLEFHRLGGSEKHLQDIKRMMPQVKSDLDFKFLENELALRCLKEYWLKIQ